MRVPTTLSFVKMLWQGRRLSTEAVSQLGANEKKTPKARVLLLTVGSPPLPHPHELSSVESPRCLGRQNKLFCTTLRAKYRPSVPKSQITNYINHKICLFSGRPHASQKTVPRDPSTTGTSPLPRGSRIHP